MTDMDRTDIEDIVHSFPTPKVDDILLDMPIAKDPQRLFLWNHLAIARLEKSAGIQDRRDLPTFREVLHEGGTTPAEYLASRITKLAPQQP